MVSDVHEITGIGEVHGIGKFSVAEEALGSGDNAEKVTVYKVSTLDLADEVDSADYVDEGPRAFLIIRKNTIEVRTDSKLRDLLREKYESVMESRYFGKGGIEIVNAGQLDNEEIKDLVRLSYNLTK